MSSVERDQAGSVPDDVDLISSLRAEVKRLREELNAVSEHYKAAIVEVGELRAENEQLRAEVERLEGDRSALLRAAADNVLEMKEHLDKLRAEAALDPESHRVWEPETEEKS